MKDLRERLAQDLKLGRLESELAEDVLRHHSKVHGLCAYSGGNLPHGQASAHRRWLEDLHEIQQNFVDMEQRAAQMKDELLEFLKHMEANQIVPDWEHPRERKRMSKELRRFYGKAFGALPRTRNSKQNIPKLTDEVYHNMLVFHKGVIHKLEQQRVSHMTAEDHMLELLASLWKEDPDESISVSVRPGLKFCRWIAVPKHVDGSKGYAVVRKFTKRWREMWRLQEVWVRGENGWTLDNLKDNT